MSHPFLEGVLTALPNLAAIQVGCSRTGIASAAMLKDDGHGNLRGQPADLKSRQTYSFYAGLPALLTLEFSDWPPQGCCDIVTIVLGSFFAFEDSSSPRLIWGTPPSVVVDSVLVTYDVDGTLTLTTKFEQHVRNFKPRALNNGAIDAYVCLRTSANDKGAGIRDLHTFEIAPFVSAAQRRASSRANRRVATARSKPGDNRKPSTS
jgi:hypothetical protein